MNNVYKALILILFVSFFNVLAQQSEKKTYELLVLEIEMYSSYQKFTANVKNLFDQAANYQNQGDYDLAIVFLEEALNQIKGTQQSEIVFDDPESDYMFVGQIISGIDYNRQEFELGFEQSDSVLLDELSKPFIGLQLEYSSTAGLFNIVNSFRYDSENLRNELFFRNKLNSMEHIFESRYGGMIDRNFEYDDLGYYEIFADLNLKSNYSKSDWYWQIKNYSRYKKFKNSSESVPDFFRNSFSTYVVRNFDFYNSIQFDYIMDFNESLKYVNNDFLEHNGGLSYQDYFFGSLKIRTTARYRYYNFTYQVSDSTFNNTSNTGSVNPNVIYDFSPFISLDIDYNVDIKKFEIKTEQEPDYTQTYFNPSLVFRIADLSSVNLGFVYEKKTHVDQKYLVTQYIKDQDYNSSGFAAGFDYTSLNGTLISVNFEYTKRRYPNFNSDADFNIYSNRNILNLLLYAQFPVYKNLMLNVIGSYDNDKDIDSDFNDTISSFYTIELSYTF